MVANEKEMRAFGRLTCAVADGVIMTREEAREAYRQVILNEQPELQQGAFLMAHIARGPTTEELSGAWEALDMYDTEKISCDFEGPVCDIVGTGSDQLKTVNCSSPAAFIAAACGLPVAKKGARLVTGVSGATDLLETLGIDVSGPLSKAEESLRRHGVCYLPGESFLKSGWARLITHMRFTSAFNIIGPLTMPCARTDTVVMGAYSKSLSSKLVDVLKGIGVSRAVSCFGNADGFDPGRGMDEFSPCGTTHVVELRCGEVSRYELRPGDFGCRKLPFEAVASSDSCEGNAARVLDVLKTRHDSPEGDFFCLNAAAALRIAGLADDYKKAFSMAKQALASGRAYEKFLGMKEVQGK